MSYATVAQLRSYLPQVKAGTTEDTLLQSILDRANEIVNDELGFSFAAWAASASARDVFNRYGGSWLDLPAHKATSVTLVYAISGRGTSTETTELVTDWIEESDGRLYADDGHAEDWYRVTAIWGYGPAPASIVEVEIEIAVNIWRGRDASGWQSDVGVDGQGATSFNRALTWAQRSVLERVRARLLGVVHA